MEPSSLNTEAESIHSDFFYGWDLLYKTIEGKIDKKADILIVLLHFLLTKHYKFRCVGIGDDKTLSNAEIGSELLPDHWNADSSKYSLRYVHGKVLYLLIAHLTGDALIVNLLDINTKNVSNICITPDSLVDQVRGCITKLIPSATDVIDRFRRELCDPVFTGHSREATTQTQGFQSATQPGQTTVNPQGAGAFMPHGIEPNPIGSPDVGRGDLDPLGRGTGNLFTFGPNSGLGRFDPFGPVIPRMPGAMGPSPDHMRPPNWNPDYHM